MADARTGTGTGTGPSLQGSATRPLSTPGLLPDSRQPVIIAARRTPLCRARGALKTLRAHELLAPVLRSLLAGTGAGPGLDPASVTDVVIGNAVGGGGNVARLAALEAGLPVSIPGITVDRQCGSGLDAIALASRLVAAGGDGVYLAGGVESISTAPLRAHRNDDGDPEFFRRARFAPDSHGDPDMGVAAENVAARFGISRARQDAVALRSHSRALAAAADGLFDAEIVPLGAETGAAVAADDGPRRGLTAAVLARFPPAFVADGSVTAGNSCFDADGAAAVVVTSLRRARELGARDGLLVLGTETAGVDPQLLGIGAGAAGERLLSAHALTAADVGLVEFNEAFASQTIACLDQLGIDPSRANLDGGALALGHAYGASGAVLVTRLLAQARRAAGQAEAPAAGQAEGPAAGRGETRAAGQADAPAAGQLALALISGAGGLGTAALMRYTRLG